MTIFKKKLIVLNFIISCLAMLGFGVKNKLDTKFFYTGQEAQSFFSSLSQEASAAYLINEWIDLYYLFSYGLVFYLLLGLFYRHQKTVLALVLFPVVFDLMETSWIIFILSTQRGRIGLDLLGVITCLKWVSVGLIFFFLFIGVIKKIHRKN